MKNTMRYIVAAALLALVGSGCAGRNTGATAAINDTPNRRVTTVTDRQGNTTETVLDNSGRAAAAEGQAVLSTEEMWKKLVSRVPDKESPEYGWTMTDTSYSVLDIPNEERIKELQVNHKKILEDATRFAEAGMTKQYDDAIASAASLAGEIATLIKARTSGETGQRGDRASIVSRTISVGPDHTKVPLAQAQAMQAAVTSRHGNQNTIKVVDKETSTDTSTTEEIRIAFESRNIIAAQQARLEELRLLREQSKKEGRIVEEVITDEPTEDTKPEPDTPSTGDRPSYDSLGDKKNYVYKTRLAANRPVTRHDTAFLIPLDRPKPTSLYIPGQKVVEFYESKSERRWLFRLKGEMPNTPASAVVTYEDGNTETFPIASLAGRTDKPAGPYPYSKKPADPAPVTPDPVTPPVTGDTIPVPAL